jgi:Xaa-Pro aminopeptidase
MPAAQVFLARRRGADLFQSFEVVSSPETGPKRLELLRAELRAEGLDGFLVPRADAHQGEYVADCDARLSWLTGFTGSAGFAAILAETAGVFIDGRYRSQVKSQVDLEHFTPVHWPEIKLGNWLIEALPKGGTVGYDRWLHTRREIEELADLLDESGINLQPCANLVDRIWQDRPAKPSGKIDPHPIEFSGEIHTDKAARLAVILKQSGDNSAILTLPDSICWLLNIRGNDVSHNPVVQSFAILNCDASCDFFVERSKAQQLQAHLGDQVRLHDISEFEAALHQLKGQVRLDPDTAPDMVAAILEQSGVRLRFAADPCILPKACKNQVEITGARNAHLRDAVAMVQLLCWLDQAAPKGQLSEIDVVTKLEKLRRQTGKLRDISFETISGSGPNGAIIHYRVNKDSNRTISSGEMLLIDSGGQYQDGTTDITRTIAVGRVGIEEKTCFTRVLQGMVAISRARFPNGLTGRDLDPLARYPLWLAGLDYNHGTGHGVGSYLSVHEGPQRISRATDVALQTGMILSNEPGYYREGAFGIRIENLIVVENAPALSGADKRDMLSFETLTHVPIDRRLIVTKMLSEGERNWVNAYHAKTLEMLSPHLDEITRKWLNVACATL